MCSEACAKVSLKKDYLLKLKDKVSPESSPPLQLSLLSLPPTVVVLIEAQSGAQILLWVNYIPRHHITDTLLSLPWLVRIKTETYPEACRASSSASSCSSRRSVGQGEHTNPAGWGHSLCDGDGTPGEAACPRVGHHPARHLLLHLLPVFIGASKTHLWLHTGNQQVSEVFLHLRQSGSIISDSSSQLLTPSNFWRFHQYQEGPGGNGHSSNVHI